MSSEKKYIFIYFSIVVVLTALNIIALQGWIELPKFYIKLTTSLTGYGMIVNIVNPLIACCIATLFSGIKLPDSSEKMRLVIFSLIMILLADVLRILIVFPSQQIVSFIMSSLITHVAITGIALFICLTSMTKIKSWQSAK